MKSTNQLCFVMSLTVHTRCICYICYNEENNYSYKLELGLALKSKRIFCSYPTLSLMKNSK